MTAGRGRPWAPQQPKAPTTDELKKAKEKRDQGGVIRMGPDGRPL